MKCRKIQYNFENFTPCLNAIGYHDRWSYSRRSTEPRVGGSNPSGRSVQRLLSGGIRYFRPMERSKPAQYGGGVALPPSPRLFFFRGKEGRYEPLHPQIPHRKTGRRRLHVRSRETHRPRSCNGIHDLYSQRHEIGQSEPRPEGRDHKRTTATFRLQL